MRRIDKSGGLEWRSANDNCFIDAFALDLSAITVDEVETAAAKMIWQRDDEVLFERMECSNDAEIELSKDGSRFLTAAMKVKSQRTPAIIRMFSESQSFALKELKQKEKGRAGDYQGKSLHEVTLSSSEKVWLVATAWAYLGDDGDSGEYETIYIDYDKALAKYTEEDPK